MSSGIFVKPGGGDCRSETLPSGVSLAGPMCLPTSGRVSGVPSDVLGFDSQSFVAQAITDGATLFAYQSTLGMLDDWSNYGVRFFLWEFPDAQSVPTTLVDALARCSTAQPVADSQVNLIDAEGRTFTSVQVADRYLVAMQTVTSTDDINVVPEEVAATTPLTASQFETIKSWWIETIPETVSIASSPSVIYE